MTDKTKESSALPSYEGKPVVKATLVVKGAGDGLSKSLELAPVVFHHGQRVRVLLEGTIGSVDHPMLKGSTVDDPMLIRKHVLLTEIATPIDASVGQSYLDDMRTRIRKADEERSGQTALDVEGDGDETEDGE